MDPAEHSESTVHGLEAQRRVNRQAVLDLGLDPYGGRCDGLIDLATARARYDEQADRAHQEREAERKAALKSDPSGASAPAALDKRPRVHVAGRVMLHRDNGKLVWMNLRDHSDESLQVAVSMRDCSEQGFAVAKSTDLGDLLRVSGPLMKTKAGEVTIWADSVEPCAKCLVPPPEKHAGLQDIEIRYRQRYVDMWSNFETMRVFQLRSLIVSEMRRFLVERDFLEVETPMLQTQAGGAAARPFVTHMNALGIDLYMRIAPELYLKRLLVGGLPRVFEINRNFRNEGLDKQHNPEFTMIELYQAHGDVLSVMELTEGLIRHAARTVFQLQEANPLRLPRYAAGDKAGRTLGQVADSHIDYVVDGILRLEDIAYQATMGPSVLATLQFLATQIDVDKLAKSVQRDRPLHEAPPPEVEGLRRLLAPARPAPGSRAILPFGNLEIDYERPFDRVTYAELFERALGFAPRDHARVLAEAEQRGIKTRNEKGEAIDAVFVANELFETYAEKSVDPARPTWIMDYPASLSPLTRPSKTDPSIAERADLFIAHMEIGPHYTELNDPDVQSAKFREQLAGIDDEESTFRTFDEDFVNALKVGMPPAGGMGVGIDRLMMLLTNQPTIRDVVFFPLMRPRGAGGERADGGEGPA